MAGHTFENNAVSVGQRELAKKFGYSVAKVCRLIKPLVAAKHIEVVRFGPGKRSYYLLLSPVFGQKHGKTDTVVYSKTGKRFSTMDHGKHGVAI
jgi:hypothetical protein